MALKKINTFRTIKQSKNSSGIVVSTKDNSEGAETSKVEVASVEVGSFSIASIINTQSQTNTNTQPSLSIGSFLNTTDDSDDNLEEYQTELDLDALSGVAIDAGVLPGVIYDYSRDLEESFNFSSLSSLLNRSNSKLRSINVDILSHEILKLQSNIVDQTDSNMLFLSINDLANETFSSLKEREVEKYESFADRFFVYADINSHAEGVLSGYEKQLSLLESLDDITTINNQLENQINYGNIVKEFLRDGQGLYNGKIINTLLSDKSLYTYETGKDDEKFLDRQSKTYNSLIRINDLKDFYTNVIGFSFRNRRTNFDESLLNFEIENTDRLVGQLFLNLSISNYSIYPNTDDLSNTELLSARDRVNHSALNRYPVIQIKDLNYNSRIFAPGKSAANLELLAVTGNRLNTDLILKNISDLSLSENIVPSTIPGKDFSAFLRGEFEPFNSNSRYDDRKSHIGSFHNNFENIEFKNNVFDIKILDTSVRTGDSITLDYEKIILDCRNESVTGFSYLSPTYLTLSTRYFEDNEFLQDRSDVTSRDGIFSSIKNKIKLNFFNNFSVDNNTENSLTISRLKNNFDFLGSYLSIAYSKLNANDQTYNIDLQSESFLSEDRLSPASPEAFLDAFYIDKKQGLTSRDTSLEYFDEELENQFISTLDLAGDSDVLNLFRTSLEDSNTNDFNNDNFKNDCTVFSTSNSFITASYLKEPNNFISLNQQNIDNSIKKIKTNSGKILNRRNISGNMFSLSRESDEGSEIFLKISSTLSNIKRRLSEDSKFFNDFLNKAKQKILQGESFALLYDDFEETSFDTFEKSMFIQDKKSYKNNFVEPFAENVNNTTSLILSESDDLISSHIMTSRQYREYLSKIYTKSFLRNKSTFFNRLLSDNIDIFEKSSYENDEFFGFDIMLAKSLSNKSKNDSSSIKDIIKLVLTNSISSLSGIDNQISLLKRKPITKRDSSEYGVDSDVNYVITKEAKNLFTEEVFNSAVRTVFDSNIIFDSKNFVLRSVNKLTTRNVFDTITAANGYGGVDFKFIPGYHCELMFPFKSSTFNFTNKSACETIENFSVYFSKSLRNNTSNNGVSDYDSIQRDIDSYEKNILVAISNLMYNHDIFIDENKSGIVSFTTNSSNKTIVNDYSFTRDVQNIGSDLRINYITHRFINSSNLETDTIIRDVDTDNEFERFVGEITLPYDAKKVFIPFSYFYLSDRPNTFSRKITDISSDLLKVFDVNFEGINNISEILDFIDNNSFYVKILQDIFEVMSKIFVQSYDNYVGLIVDDIRRKSIEKDCTFQEFKQAVSKFKFVGGEEQTKKLCISDLKKVLDINKDNLDNPSFIRDDLSYTHSSQNEESSNVFYTERLTNFQVISKLLKNSDIAEIISHDILHGYFANFEDNIEKEQENAESFRNSIDIIKGELEEFEGLEDFGFENFILDDFYQNYISRSIQELIYYRNFYNEVFVKNNTFNSIREKYDSINFFDHVKKYNENKIKKAKFGLERINRIFSSGSANISNHNLDIIKFPISYDIARKIGTRGILKISILPVNLKYPEIEYKQINYYYCPLLTDVTSNFIEPLGEGFNSAIGFFNDTQKISERYNVISKSNAISEIRFLVEEIFLRLSETTSTNLVEDIDAISNKIVVDAIVSNSIKALNFVSQDHFDEEVKKSNIDVENLISDKTSQLISNVDSINYRKIFENFREDDLLSIQDREGIFQIDSNERILSNSDLYKKFLSFLDKDMSISGVLSTLLPTVFYDTFDIAIDRENFVIVDTEEEILSRSSTFLRDDEKNKCFNYYIEAKVL